MFFLFAIGLGCWAYMFTSVLQEDREVFFFVRTILKKVINQGNPYNEDLIEGWRYFLHKSLTCSKCHASQLAIIIFIYSNLTIEFLLPFIGVACFTAYLISSKIDTF